jgi:hypothetical protein
MARKRLAQNPLLRGAGLAKAGLILGYVALGLSVITVVVLLAFGASLLKIVR